MPTRKIDESDVKWRSVNPCVHPEHNPPSNYVFAPGVYEHECPACGNKIIFTVSRSVLSDCQPSHDGLKVFTVRCAVLRQDLKDDFFDEMCITSSPERALAMVEHYRTTAPAPLKFKSIVIREQPYIPGKTDYRQADNPLPPSMRGWM